MTDVLLASDLDRTLIHPLKTLAPADRDLALDAEEYEDRIITVVGTDTVRDLALLAEAGSFVPVTTRSREQLARVKPVWELVRDGWSICANGGTILRDGVEDPDWRAEVTRLISGSASPAQTKEALARELDLPGGTPGLKRLRVCDDLFLYAVLDLDLIPDGLFSAAAAVVEPLGWRTAPHGRKLYLLPADLCKGAAAAWLRDRLEVECLITGGDSILDVELMEAGDIAWCPGDAELVALEAVPEKALVTEGGHVHAGNEIAAHAVSAMRSQTRI